MATDSLPAGRFSFRSRISDGRKLLWLPGVAAIVGALITAAASFAILVGITPIVPTRNATLLLAALNATFILVLIGLIWREAHRILQARQQAKAASRLHVRIVTMFALVAAIPAIMVAIIAALQLNIGLDRWFELRTKSIINYSLTIADSYVQENARSLQNTTLSMAAALDANRQLYNLDRTGFLEFLTRLRQGGAVAHAALIGPDGSSIMAARTNADFPMPEPPPGAVEDAKKGEPVLIEPRTRNIVGAVFKLRQFDDTYLYTVRTVDPEVIRAREIVRANSNDYRDMETNRGVSQVVFALPYLSLTLIIVLSAIWTGIAVADRLVRPIRQLIGAADEVATGNLDVQVPVRQSDGDVGHLSGTFNNMLFQLKSQRNELLTAKDQIDDRRRFSEAVLSGVSSGVIGVDQLGTVTIVNRSAEQMLGIVSNKTVGKNLSVLLPHIGKVFEVGRRSGKPVYREQVTFFRSGAERTYNTQVTTESDGTDGHDMSYVVTVDDITDLVQAQRSSAWADVARRIAHEIKNPLTPIQLSAERIRRRYGKVITEDREIFDQCTDTIIRQVEGIGRMVDEFSAFARMPKPDMKTLDLREPLREASFLVEVSRSDITFERDFGPEPLPGTFDTRLLAQAFGNIVKNAAEAIDGRGSQSEPGVIRVQARLDGNRIRVDIIDNGKGLPRENRQRLLEPYMTTREKGTGLGLAIVKKIIEDHGGTLELNDAPVGFHGGKGAMISVTLPAAVVSPDTKLPGLVQEQRESPKRWKMASDILIVDDEQDIRELVAGILDDEGHETRTAHDSDSALAAIADRVPRLVFLDIWLQGSRLDGLDLLDQIKKLHPGLPVVMISGHGNVETAVSAIRRGAYDFIEKPFKADRLILIAERALETSNLKREVSDLKQRSGETYDLIGMSSGMSHLRQTIERVAPTNSRIMIIGPSGSGKELVARAIHAQSARRAGPFVTVNAAAITPERMEIELFGTESNGAERKVGALEEAHRGILYLDEVADMPRETQNKILRVLVDQQFERVGGAKRVKVDVRIIASTAQNLEAMIAEGRFREDLYHRLAVVPVLVPGLAERREDIPYLVDHFMKQIAKQAGIRQRRIADDALAVLQAHSWPGNVRQLRNNIERLMILVRSEDANEPITADLLPAEIGDVMPKAPNQSDVHIMALPLREAREVFEKEYLVAQINRFGGNISRTAEFVGMERSALHRKLKSLGV